MKSKDQKRREAMERKQKFLPVYETRLRESMLYLEQHPQDTYAIRQFIEKLKALDKARLEAGLQHLTSFERRKIIGWKDSVHSVAVGVSL